MNQDKIALGVLKKHQKKRVEQEKQAEFSSWLITLPLLAFVTILDVFLAIVATFYMIAPQYGLTVNPASPAGKMVIDLFSQLFLASTCLTAFSVLAFWADHLGISFFQPVYTLPSGYIEGCFIMAGLVVVSFAGGRFTYPAQIIILLSSIWLLVTIWQSRRRIAAIVKEIGQARVQSAKDMEERKTYCEVCAEESLYDICLDCEQKYRPERHRVRAQILRAKTAGTEATLTLPQWLENLSVFNWRCAYCQTGQYQVIEHYVPVSQGGGTTQENCFPACFSCNSKKSNQHPDAIRARYKAQAEKRKSGQTSDKDLSNR